MKKIDKIASKSLSNSNKIKCYEYSVNGIKCATCELELENKLSQLEGVTDVKVDSSKNLVIIKSNLRKEELDEEVLKVLNEKGVLYDVIEYERKFDLIAFIIGISITALIVLFFNILNGFNYLSIDVGSNYLTFILVGVLASFSSCGAMVGGLLLSVTAKENQGIHTRDLDRVLKTRLINQTAFHISRLITFFLLGGVLGLLGRMMSIIDIVSLVFAIISVYLIFRPFKIFKDAKGVLIYSITVFLVSFFFKSLILIFSQLTYILAENLAQAFLLLFITLYLMVLSLEMLGVSFFASFFKQIHLPKFIPKFFLKNFHHIHTTRMENFLMYVFLGFLSFFLPCGFTLTAQTFALNSGSFINGGLIMLFFALGTLPMLILISVFALKTIKNKFFNKVFINAAASLMLVLSFYYMINLLRFLGINI